MKTILIRFLPIFLGVSVVASCRTTLSTGESKAITLPVEHNFTLDSWKKSCEADLKDPKTGSESRAELKKLANTDDCEKAYPEIRKIVDAFYSQTKPMK